MINKAILVGNIGQAPELKYTPSGQAVCTISVATSRSWKDKDGQKQDETEWHRVIVWGKQAEFCGQYLSKGGKVYVEGRLATRKWKDQAGADRYTTEIVAREMKMLSGRTGSGAGSEPGEPPPMGEDVPF